MQVRNLDNGEPVAGPSLLSELIAQRAREQQAQPAPRPIAKPRMNGVTRFLLGIVVTFIGLLQWAPAARFTVDGWTGWINGIGGWFGFAQLLPRLSATPLIVAMVVVGILYSLIETQCIPLQRVNGRMVFGGMMALVGWLFLSATDVGSTYAGLIAPPPGAPQAWREIAQSQPVSAFLSFYLTFAPDWFIIGGIRLTGLDRLLGGLIAWLLGALWRR